MQIIKDLAAASNISEKQIAEIMKASFFLGRDCPNFEVAKEITDEMDTFIYNNTNTKKSTYFVKYKIRDKSDDIEDPEPRAQTVSITIEGEYSEDKIISQLSREGYWSPNILEINKL